MARPRCDVFDAPGIVAAIANGETSTVQAWRAYAANAARPCARATFAKTLSAARTAISRRSAPNILPARHKAADAPPVLVIGPNAALRGRGGALDIEHGPAAERSRVRLDIDDAKPHTILFDAHGEFLTGEAIRWCAAHAINIILPNGPGRAILFTESALETADAPKGKAGAHAQRIRDVSPSLIRAQCAADPVCIAREIVRAKLRASALHVETIPVRSWDARLNTARSVAELVTIEALIASAYWRAFRDLGLREAKGGNLPRSWLRFANRQKGALFLGSRHASHPINAMLNYAYVVEAGRLARALAALGLTLPIGFLHSDRKGRNSLVWDAIEPLRPAIDARVFALSRLASFAAPTFRKRGATRIGSTGRLSRRSYERRDCLGRKLRARRDGWRD